MGDLNLLNVFFDADNFMFKSDMKDFPHPSKEICELEEEPVEWFSEDTLNQMLPLLDKFFNNCDENIGNASVNEHSFDDNVFLKPCSASPEENDTNEELTVNAKFVEDVPVDTFFQSNSQQQNEKISKCETNFSTSDENFFDAIDYVREEVIEFEEISVCSSPLSDVSVLLDDDSSDDYECEVMSDNSLRKMKIVYPKYSTIYQKSMTSSPSKKIKLTKKLENENVWKKEKKRTNDVNSWHPRLQLTSEEIKVASKERIELPSHYPLTKEQQRQLKRIRRKIRNKISAQHSRRRKQEHVEKLEQELKRNSEEKVRLLGRIKSLESEKSTMASKISKLQATLARCSGQMAQPTSCLLVLIMSLALILAPSLKNSSLMHENVGEEDISVFDGQSSSMMNSVRSSSRNLLFSQNSSENQNDAKEEFKMITDLLRKIRFSNSHTLAEFLDLLRINSNEKDPSWKKKSYFEARKHENLEINEGDLQAPSKTITSELLSRKFIDNVENETADIELRQPATINWRVI